MCPSNLMSLGSNMREPGMVRWLLPLAGRFVGGVVLLSMSPQAFGAGTNVNVVDFAFNPSAVTIKANDSVTWTWTGNIVHSTTSVDGTQWDSGVLPKGSTFSHTFTSTGSFPYYCTVHPFMTGSVTVQGQVQTNSPPVVSITSPTNGSVFVAPWTGAIRVSASDSDGTVTKLAVFAGTTLLGTVTNPPASVSLNVTNLAAGNYNLTAVATDNGGATTTSAAVAISVVTPTGVTLASVQRSSASTFKFTYNVAPGLSYVVERSTNLLSWIPLSTNVTTGSSASFTDTAASGAANFYRVTLLPSR